MTEKNKAGIHQILDYRVIAEIGRGAASVIYAVSDAKFNIYSLKHVILKGSKDDRFLEQAENEVKVSNKLDHPGIRKIHKLHKVRPGWSRTEVAVLMEMLDADSLDMMKLGLDDLLNVFMQVASGLAHMNERGFVHADMKPTNVMVNENLEAKIIDLGQACKLGTIKQRIQGTPGFMAPEQANREEVTEKTDVYNFGATMYWLLTGKEVPTARPESGKNSAKLPPPPESINPDVPKELSDLVMRSIQPDPNARVNDMNQVLEGLKELQSDLSTNGSPALKC